MSYFLLDKNGQIFMKQWLNNKKWQRLDKQLQWWQFDKITRWFKLFVSLWDLGFNIVSWLASGAGAFLANYSWLIKWQYKNWIKRRYFWKNNKKKSQNILEKYKWVLWQSPIEKLTHSSTVAQDKIIESAFSFMAIPWYNAMQTFFIGKLSEDEFLSGEISWDRLRKIQWEIWEFHPLARDKSITWSTLFWWLATQYKTWMIPLLYSSYKNVKAVTGEVMKLRKLWVPNSDILKKIWWLDEFRKSVNLVVWSFIIWQGANALFLSKDNEEEKEFKAEFPVMAKLRDKVLRELWSVQSVFSIWSWNNIRVLGKLEEIQGAIVSLVKFEEYKVGNSRYWFEKWDLKGLNKIKRLIKPRFLDGVWGNGGDLEVERKSRRKRRKRRR